VEEKGDSVTGVPCRNQKEGHRKVCKGQKDRGTGRGTLDLLLRAEKTKGKKKSMDVTSKEGGGRKCEVVQDATETW